MSKISLIGNASGSGTLTIVATPAAGLTTNSVQVLVFNLASSLEDTSVLSVAGFR